MATFLATKFNLDKPERVAVAVESCYQNTGIATSVAAVMFDGDKDSLAEAICVPLYYGFCEAVLLGIFCLLAWKAGWTKAPKDERICVILTENYEVSEQDASAARAASTDDILGDISNSEESHELELGEGGHGVPKPTLVFEEATETDLTIDEEADPGVVSIGAAVLRKVDGYEIPRLEDGHVDDEKWQQSKSSSSASLPGEEGELDGNGSEHVGRFGKTISFVKARATGYRRAPESTGAHEGEGTNSIIPQSSPSSRVEGACSSNDPDEHSDIQKHSENESCNNDKSGAPGKPRKKRSSSTLPQKKPPMPLGERKSVASGPK